MPRGKKSTKRKVVKRGRRGRPRGGAARGSVSTGLVRNIEQYRQELIGQRDAIDQKLSALDQALRAFSGGGARARAARAAAPARAEDGRAGAAFRPGSLKDYITQVLASGGTRTVKDISQAVIDAGYKTKNRTLATSVGLALAEMPNVRKVSRGTYRLK